MLSGQWRDVTGVRMKPQPPRAALILQLIDERRGVGLLLISSPQSSVCAERGESAGMRNDDTKSCKATHKQPNPWENSTASPPPQPSHTQRKEFTIITRASADFLWAIFSSCIVCFFRFADIHSVKVSVSRCYCLFLVSHSNCIL